MNFVEATFVMYVITFLITTSHALEPVRNLIRDGLLKIKFDFAVTEYDFISCRMCVGAWIALGFALFTGDYVGSVTAYGASYFLATQERHE